MKYARLEKNIAVMVEQDGNIHDALETICAAEQVAAGTVSGFGGVNYLKLGIWNNAEAHYDYFETSAANMELTSLQGNITMLNGKPMAHIHVTAADDTFRVFGGHLVQGTVQNLMELFIQAIPGEVHRIRSGCWNVMDLPEYIPAEQKENA